MVLFRLQLNARAFILYSYLNFFLYFNEQYDTTTQWVGQGDGVWKYRTRCTGLDFEGIMTEQATGRIGILNCTKFSSLKHSSNIISENIKAVFCNSKKVVPMVKKFRFESNGTVTVQVRVPTGTKKKMYQSEWCKMVTHPKQESNDFFH